MKVPRRLVMLLILLATIGPATGHAGEIKRSAPIRIGALTPSWGPSPAVVGLREGLLQLGYHEYKDFIIGVRFTQGDLAALPAAAQELVQYGVDLIFTSTDAVKAAQLATTEIPIVFAGSDDPVEKGLVQSFARPGGNITGVTTLALHLAPKRLEMFHEIVPGLKRVLYPYDPSDADSSAEARMYRDAARRLGIELVEQTLRTEEEAEASLGRVHKEKIDGILPPVSVSLNIPGFVLEATSQGAIPAMFEAAFWVERGGLGSYGPDLYDTGRQAARLVDKILKGASPAEIPVEVNTKILFALNLRVAKTLGLHIAPEVIYRADRLVR